MPLPGEGRSVPRHIPVPTPIPAGLNPGPSPCELRNNAIRYETSNIPSLFFVIASLMPHQR